MCQTHQFCQGRGESIGRLKQLDTGAYEMFCDDVATLQVSLDTLQMDNPHLDQCKARFFLPPCSYICSPENPCNPSFHNSHQPVDSSVRQHFACLSGGGSRPELDPTVVSPMIDVSLPRIHSEAMARILHHSLSSLQPLGNRTQAKPQQTINPASHEAPVSFLQASLRSLLQAQV